MTHLGGPWTLTYDGAALNLRSADPLHSCHMDVEHKLALPQVTLRATLVGLAIGLLVLVLNFQFGLQTGWVLMMLLPLALLGYAVFHALPLRHKFTDVENVFVQSVAVAAGTGPLAFGLVGIIPAIEKFLSAEETGYGHSITFSMAQLMVWLLGLGFFGVFFAVPLRKQVIVREKLPFPLGLATATLVLVLHQSPTIEGDAPSQSDQEYHDDIVNISSTFVVSLAVTLALYFWPILKAIPIFGTYLSRHYLWNFQLLAAYIGQGMIMGLQTTSYMLFGCILGWGILGPLAHYQGWAPGPTDDWKHGAQGWILWVLLAAMVADLVVSLIIISVKLVRSLQQRRLRETEPLLNSGDDHDVNVDDVPKRYLISPKFTAWGIVASSLLCVVLVKWVYGLVMPVYAIMVALALTFIFAILGVRALGETDLNPVSGIGKLSQLVFAVVVPRGHPARLLINLVAGGIAEAGAQQAGDLMQDLKTGQLLGASPRAQFIAQCIGTLFLVALSSVMYKVYNQVYTIPSDNFRIPTAIIWVDCLRLVTGEGLPPMAWEASVITFVVFAAIAIAKNVSTSPKLRYLPSGVAVGIGIYNTPNFTLARFVGGVISYWWMKRSPRRVAMIIFLSGLVLGEGVFSAVVLALRSMGI